MNQNLFNFYGPFFLCSTFNDPFGYVSFLYVYFSLNISLLKCPLLLVQLLEFYSVSSCYANNETSHRGVNEQRTNVRMFVRSFVRRYFVRSFIHKRMFLFFVRMFVRASSFLTSRSELYIYYFEIPPGSQNFHTKF